MAFVIRWFHLPVTIFDVHVLLTALGLAHPVSNGFGGASLLPNSRFEVPPIEVVLEVLEGSETAEKKQVNDLPKVRCQYGFFEWFLSCSAVA